TSNAVSKMTDELMKRIATRKSKTHKNFRDVLLVINGGISDISSLLMKYVPYITFDLSKQNKPTENDIAQIMYYLENINIMSNTYYTEFFPSVEGLLKEKDIINTSIGKGLAVAFYFNYAKLIALLQDHTERVKLIKLEVENENISDKKQHIFIDKWIFVLPWTTAESGALLTKCCSIKNEEFKLALWKAKNSKAHKGITFTLGGMVGRDYTPLAFYELTKTKEDKTFVFAMEVPAAFHGLKNRYENLRSKFSFGEFHPVQQAKNFQEEVEHCYNRDKNAEWHNSIILISLPTPPNSANSDEFTSKFLLEELWTQCCAT
ncbi:unnamed protein product, partial [Didymodactylos carnosus]